MTVGAATLLVFPDELKIVNDVSNYDADYDASSGKDWVAAFIDDGVDGVVVGSQWLEKSDRQLAQLRAGDMFIAGTYAEPDAKGAIDRALAWQAMMVGLACERGSILSYAELIADINMVEDAGLSPWAYGNIGDLVSVLGLDLIYSGRVGLWLAGYGSNNSDPSVLRTPIRAYDFGRGPVELMAHQFNSTIEEAGRARDHSYWYGPVGGDIVAVSQADYDKLIVRLAAGSERHDDNGVMDSYESRLATAQAWLNDSTAQSTHDLAASASFFAKKAVEVSASGQIGGQPAAGMTPEQVTALVDAEFQKARITVG